MSGYYLLLNGEFAYNKSYSAGYDFGSIKRLDRYPMGALSTLYICFALKKYDSDFIKTYFDSLKWYKEIYMISAEGARNHGLLNVPTEEFFDTYHYLTACLGEQRKIAQFMYFIEQRIQKQQELVDSLKKYKRGAIARLIEKMDFSNNVPLAELCSIKTGKLDANQSVVNGSYPFFTCSKETLMINDYAFDGEAILIAGNGDLGHTRYYRGKFNAYQRTYVIMDAFANMRYLKCVIDQLLPAKIHEESQGGAMPYIKLSTLATLLVPVPSRSLQDWIAEFDAALTNKIELAEESLIKLERLKKGIISQLFI